MLVGTALAAPPRTQSEPPSPLLPAVASKHKGDKIASAAAAQRGVRIAAHDAAAVYARARGKIAAINLHRFIALRAPRKRERGRGEIRNRRNKMLSAREMRRKGRPGEKRARRCDQPDILLSPGQRPSLFRFMRRRSRGGERRSRKRGEMQKERIHVHVSIYYVCERADKSV